MWYDVYMRAVAAIPDVSDEKQAASNDQSKRINYSIPAATLFARLRRLELRVINLEAVSSTTRRDVYRIEKKQQRTPATALSHEKTSSLPADIAGLFDA